MSLTTRPREQVRRIREDQTVDFQPMYVDGPQPWYVNLFLLYLLLVVVVFLVRLIKLTIHLRRLRKAQKYPGATMSSDAMWSDCYAKAHSLKEISALTFLISLLTFTWYAVDVLASIRFAKRPSTAFVLARFGDGLPVLAFGLIFCIGLYFTAMVTQSRLRRWKPAPSASNQI